MKTLQGRKRYSLHLEVGPMRATLAALSRSMRKMMYFGAVQCIDNLQRSWFCSAESNRLRTRFCRLGWAIASP
jgi:hypothetical protein